jgi:predicted HTH transcriptional regulator
MSQQLQKHLNKLKQLSVIERIGHDNGGYWKINQ